MKPIKSQCLIIFLIFSSAFTTVPSSNVINVNEINYSITDCQWPMNNYNAQHTSSSPFSTSDNHGGEHWKFSLNHSAYSKTPIIDAEGIIYAVNKWSDLYALYPNGTLKWSHHFQGNYQISNPALDSNGTLYLAIEDQLFAFYLNGTVKWSVPISGWPFAEIVVGPDGTIFVAADNILYTVSPNGTIIRFYEIPNVINGISVDIQGNVYLSGWQNRYVYSFSPDGNLRWSFRASYVFDSLTIDKDGTVYLLTCPYVYALDQSGQFKWISDVDLDGGSPSIAPDGTLVVSSLRGSRIVGLDPSNGLYRWEFNIGEDNRDMTRASIDIDGTIYFAATDESIAYLYSLSSLGTFKWKTKLTCDFPYDVVDVYANPSIGIDGTVYMTTWFMSSEDSCGYIHAIGDPDAPTVPDIAGNQVSKLRVEQEFSFKASSPIGSDIFYFVNWGDGEIENWTGPYASGEEIRLNHSWAIIGSYRIEAMVKDVNDLYGPWGTFEIKITNPRNKLSLIYYRMSFLDRFPFLERLLKILTRNSF